MRTKMNFSDQLPPIYDRCVEKFGVSFDDGIIFAYGDTIYSKNVPPEDLCVHEAVHLKQQEDFGGPEKWWDKYLEDDKFRLAQEVEAYRAQYAYLKKIIKDRNILFKAMDGIARDLSSSIYGKIVSYWDAIELLK